MTSVSFGSSNISVEFSIFLLFSRLHTERNFFSFCLSHYSRFAHLFVLLLFFCVIVVFFCGLCQFVCECSHHFNLLKRWLLCITKAMHLDFLISTPPAPRFAVNSSDSLCHPVYKHACMCRTSLCAFRILSVTSRRQVYNLQFKHHLDVFILVRVLLLLFGVVVLFFRFCTFCWSKISGFSLVEKYFAACYLIRISTTHTLYSYTHFKLPKAFNSFLSLPLDFFSSVK